MKIDVLIKNGTVIDPYAGFFGRRDLGMCDGRFVDVGDISAEPDKVVDAKGCCVFPGLVDFHTHVFYQGESGSIYPEYLPCTGVTSLVDAGSAGCMNYKAFHDSILTRSRLNIKAYLCYYDFGVCFEQETYAGKGVHHDEIKRIFEKYRDELLGIKIRFTKSLVPDLEPLENCVRLAHELGTGVCVHTTNPPCTAGQILSLLSPGDVFCHVFQGGENNILDERGKVSKAVWEAKKRGVLFDLANGRCNFSFAVAQAAMHEQFIPDIISTDMTAEKLFYHPTVRSLPHIMSKMMALGMTMEEIAASVTSIPARLMRQSGRIGTLSPGAKADAAIFRLQRLKATHRDFQYQPCEVARHFIPQMTVIDGEIAYCREDFNLF